MSNVHQPADHALAQLTASLTAERFTRYVRNGRRRGGEPTEPSDSELECARRRREVVDEVAAFHDPDLAADVDAAAS